MITPTPIAIGTTAIVVAPKRTNRSTIRFQNNGNTNLYFVRQITSTPNIPSSTNFDFSLGHGGPVEEAYETNSTAQFNCVSSGANGSLAIYETVKT